MSPSGDPETCVNLASAQPTYVRFTHTDPIPSQSTSWELALATHPILKIPPQNLLHIHVAFPQLQAPGSGFTSFTAAAVCKARHPRLLFFTITCLNIPTLLLPRSVPKKKKITQHICQISEHCLCRHVPLVTTPTFQKHSCTHLQQVACLRISQSGLFVKINHVRLASFFFLFFFFNSWSSGANVTGPVSASVRKTEMWRRIMWHAARGDGSYSKTALFLHCPTAAPCKRDVLKDTLMQKFDRVAARLHRWSSRSNERSGEEKSSVQTVIWVPAQPHVNGNMGMSIILNGSNKIVSVYPRMSTALVNTDLKCTNKHCVNLA